MPCSNIVAFPQNGFFTGNTSLAYVSTLRRRGELTCQAFTPAMALSTKRSWAASFLEDEASESELWLHPQGPYCKVGTHAKSFDINKIFHE